LNNGLSKTLAPTIVINWLRSRAEAGQAKPKAIATPSTKRALDGNELVTATEASKTLSKNNSNKPTSIH